MPRLLCIDHGQAVRTAILQTFSPEWECYFAADARTAILQADDVKPDVVVVELSLAGHSGLEFLYEFRTYDDWRDIPIIVYTTIRLQPEVTASTAWKQLNIARYLYKPNVTLKTLKDAVEKLHTSGQGE
jgi:CheY-like chemotaxis protein